MIKFFTYKEFVNEENRRIIFPLLLDLFFYNDTMLSKLYSFTNKIEEAEVVIIPIDINYFFKGRITAVLDKMIDESLEKGKIVWVYSGGDYGKTISKDIFTFRLGGFQSKLDAKTLIVPAFIEDPYKLLNEKFQPLAKKMEPQVGFVGYANGSTYKLLKEFLIYLKTGIKRKLSSNAFDYQSFFPSGTSRFKNLKKIETDPDIETSFIYRKRYRAGAKTKKERALTSMEFYRNISDNPYTFCMRGTGNFSVRLYEVLASGRMPIILNTDCMLPLPWKNWNKHCLLTSEKNLLTDIKNYHQNISDKEFIKAQEDNRNFWFTNLTRIGYFTQIHDYFKKR